MTDCIRIENLYDLSHTAAADLMKQYDYPWEILPEIGDFILKLGATLSPEEYDKRGDDIWVAKSATVFDLSLIHI